MKREALRELALTGSFRSTAVSARRQSRELTRSCKNLRDICESQRERLAFQRAALMLRNEWHSLPLGVRKAFYLQKAIERTVKPLVDSCDDEQTT